MTKGIYPRRPALFRFWQKVFFADSGCWEWTGHLNWGYGRFHFQNALVYAHRFSYEHLRGEVPPGLQLDHLCRNRRCVNPYHLEAVTAKENIRRGNTGNNQTQKTHCPHGHHYDEENTLIECGVRRCRICQKVKDHTQYIRKKQRALAKA